MKKVLSMCIAGALVAGLIATVGAQGAGPKGQKGSPGVSGGQNGQRPGGGGRRMADLMGKIQPPLTADQKKKIETINKNFREQMQKLRGNAQPGQPPKPGQQNGARPDMAKFQDLMKKRNDAILKVLNAKQQASFKKLLADMEKQMQERRRQGGGRGPNGGTPPPTGGKTGGGKGGGTKPPL